MSKTNPPYPAAFRSEAVALVRTSGKSIPVVARDLGVSEQGLRDWMQRSVIEAGEGPPGVLTDSERTELMRLRREIQAQGFAYSLTNVQRFVAELRRASGADGALEQRPNRRPGHPVEVA